MENTNQLMVIDVKNIKKTIIQANTGSEVIAGKLQDVIADVAVEVKNRINEIEIKNKEIKAHNKAVEENFATTLRTYKEKQEKYETLINKEKEPLRALSLLVGKTIKDVAVIKIVNDTFYALTDVKGTDILLDDIKFKKDETIRFNKSIEVIENIIKIKEDALAYREAELNNIDINSEGKVKELNYDLSDIKDSLEGLPVNEVARFLPYTYKAFLSAVLKIDVEGVHNSKLSILDACDALILSNKETEK